MANSPLVDVTIKSPNHSGKRTHSIDRITPHCVVGQLSAGGIGGCFRSAAVGASCNYGIGTDGKVVLVVDEDKRSWCSSSKDNDQRAVTIECASDKTSPYAFNDKVYNKLIDLCIDICMRNGKKKLLWFGDKNKSLNYKPAADEMVLTVHRWFKNKSCPGDWMYSNMGELARVVTLKLGKQTEKKAMRKLQLGAFTKKKNAEKLLASVKAKGFDAFVIKSDGWWKVQVGAYSSEKNAQNAKKSLKNAGFIAILVRQ